MFAFLKSALYDPPPGSDPHLRSPPSRTPELPCCRDATVISRLRGSARGILVGMNLAGPSGTNKQLPTTPPTQPLLDSVNPQKRKKGKRKKL